MGQGSFYSQAPGVMKHLQVKIAETVIAAVAGDDCPPFRVQPAYQPFLVEGLRPAVTLRVHYGDIPDLPLGEKIFHSGGVWNLYRHVDKYLMVMTDFRPGSRPYRLAVFDRTFTSGEIYLQQQSTDADPTPAAFVDPLEPPLDQFLMAIFLARRRLGVILHACGISDQGRGLAFCGVSEAGKSTLARLWQDAPVTVLTDERLIVRRVNGRFWIYGTPWVGEAQISSPEKAPLEKVYVINHSPKNSLHALSSPVAASQLLVRCFPPFFDQIGMQNILELLAQIAEEIPCYDLGFIPDRQIVDLVRFQQ
jgi:hypothetical protein